MRIYVKFFQNTIFSNLALQPIDIQRFASKAILRCIFRTLIV